MSTIFIVGGSGKVARRLTPLLVRRGHRVSSLHRKPDQATELAELGATPVKGDLAALSVEDLAALMRGHEAVVFSAGAGGAGIDITRAIDGDGLKKSVDAAKAADVTRMLLVSVFPDALRDGERKEGFEIYIKVKKAADAYLVASGLDFAIVRPGTLTEDSGTGRVHADLAIPYGDIPRDDVAAFLAELIDQQGLRRLVVELTGGDTPIAEAASRLA